MIKHSTILLSVIALLAAVGLHAIVPAWWKEHNVIPLSSDQTDAVTINDNYEFALIGQAKFMAYQAYQAMESKEIGSAGVAIADMVNNFSTAEADNYEDLLLGQLKAIALPFYERFNATDYDVNGDKAYTLELISELTDTNTDSTISELDLPATGSRHLVIAHSTSNNTLYFRFFNEQGNTADYPIALTDPDASALDATLNSAPVFWDSNNLTVAQKTGILGQAVAMTAHYVDLILYQSYDYTFPWPDPTTANMDDNYVVANIGQMKYLFSFSLAEWGDVPELLIATPSLAAIDQPIEVNTFTIDIVGQAVSSNLKSIHVNGVAVPSANIQANGSFTFSQPLDLEGANSIVIVVEDQSANQVSESFTVFRITEPPVLTLSNPVTDDVVTRQSTFNVAGQVSTSATTLTVKGQLIPSTGFAGGNFIGNVTLVEGENVIIVEASDHLGNTRTVQRTIIRDTVAPIISVTNVEDNFITKTAEQILVGEIEGAATLTVNGNDVSLAQDGSFSTSVLLAEGTNEISLQAIDAVGNASSLTLSGTLDSIPPVFTITAPVQDALIATPTFTVKVSIEDSTSTLSINGETPSHDGSTTFSRTISLSPGTNAISVTATDAAGNSTTQTLNVFQDGIAPTVAFIAPTPTDGSTVNTPTINISGTIDDGNSTVDINSLSAQVSEDLFILNNFALIEGSNTLVAEATDAAGNIASISLNITLDTVAPSVPVLTAPATNPTYIASDRVTLTGTAEPNTTVIITGGLLPVDAPVDGSGNFSREVLLAANQISNLTLKTIDGGGNSSLVTTQTVISDTLDPVIDLTTPTNNESLDSTVVEFIGFVSDANLDTTLTVGGDSVPILDAGGFAHHKILPVGDNQNILLSVTDLAGNTTTTTVTVNIPNTSDTEGPAIAVLSPVYDAVVDNATQVLELLVTDASTINSLTVEGSEVAMPPPPYTYSNGNYTISALASVTGDTGTFTIVAQDSADPSNTTTIVHKIQVNGNNPAPITVQLVSPQSPTNASEVTLYNTTDISSAGFDYSITGGLHPVNGVVAADGKFNAVVALKENETNTLNITVTGSNGLPTSVTEDVVSDTILPTISSTTPVSGAVDISLDSTINIQWSESMLNDSAVNQIQLLANGTPVSFTHAFSVNDTVLTITPDAAFNESTVIEVNIPDTLQDLAGNTLTAPYSFEFTTQDNSAPAAPVIDTGSIVARTNQDTVTISGTAEPLSSISITGGAATVNVDADSAGDFTASVTLTQNSLNNLDLTATDAASNTSAASSITIEHDDTQISVASTIPNDAATGVVINTSIVITFSEEIDMPLAGGIALVGSGIGIIQTSSNYDSPTQTLTLVPEADLANDQDYEIVIPGNITDLAGNALGTTARYSFTTVASSAPATPIIYEFFPQDITSLTELTISGFSTPGTTVEATGGASPVTSPEIGGTGLFNITVLLIADATNSITLQANKAAVLSPATDPITIDQDSTSPSIVSTTPIDGQQSVSVTETITITFDEPVAAAPFDQTIPPVLVYDNLNQVVAGEWGLSDNAESIFFFPIINFNPNTNYTIQIGPDVIDLAGNLLGATTTIDFTTDAAATVILPEAPILDPIPPEFTTEQIIQISGTALPNSILHVLGGQTNTTTNVGVDGRFSVTVPLLKDSLNELIFTVEENGVFGHNTTATINQILRPTGLRLVSPKLDNEYNNQSLMVSGIMDNVTEFLNVQVQEDYTIQLIPGLSDTTQVPVTGERLVVIAEVSSELYFRIFERDGAISSYTESALIATKASEIAAFKTLLQGSSLNLQSGLSNISEVTSTGTNLVVVAQIGSELHIRLFDGTGASVDYPQAQFAGSSDELTEFNDYLASLWGQTLSADEEAGVFERVSVLTGISDFIPMWSFPSFADSQRDTLLQQVADITGYTFLDEFEDAALFGRYFARQIIFDGYDLKLHTNISNWDTAGNRMLSIAQDATNADVLHFRFFDAHGASVDYISSDYTDTESTATILSINNALTALSWDDTNLQESDIKPITDLVSSLTGHAIGDIITDYSVDLMPSLISSNEIPTVGFRTLIIADVAGSLYFRFFDSNHNFEDFSEVQFSDNVTEIADLKTTLTTLSWDESNLTAQTSQDLVSNVLALTGPFQGEVLRKTVTARAYLVDGSTVDESSTFTLNIQPYGVDTRAPVVHILFPDDNEISGEEVIETLAVVEEGVRLASVDIGGVTAHRALGNFFFIYAPVPEQGDNIITVQAYDAEGQIGQSSVNVFLDSIGVAEPVVDTVAPLVDKRVITVTGTAEPGSIIVVENGLVPVRSIVPASGNYSIRVPLNPNASNRLTLYASDLAGNDSEVSIIELDHDDTAPYIVSTNPVHEAVGIPENTSMTITFSEPLNAATLTLGSTVTVESFLNPGPFQGDLLLSADGTTIEIIPSFKFDREDTITVTLKPTIADVNGIPFGQEQFFSFQTAIHKTTFSGVVIDPDLKPLPNVKVGIVGTDIVQLTSSFGTFLLDDVPLGDQLLFVDARPDATTGLPPQGDNRVFNYLEFLVPVIQNTDSSLGRPIFMVDTDFSTSTVALASGTDNEIIFSPLEKDLTDFKITYDGGSIRFGDGTSTGSLTATRIDIAHIPDRLPSGAIPHFLVEIGPDDLSFESPAKLTFPNVYASNGLEAGDEVIVFHFKYGVHNYTELGRATVDANGLIETAAILTDSGFVGIVPADASFDLTRAYLNGRVVDASTPPQGISGVEVNAIAGSSYVITDAEGYYSIPMPDVRLELVRTFATLKTNLGDVEGESPSLVFESEIVSMSPSGVTEVPDIVVDSFNLGGNIRYIDADDMRVQVTSLAYDANGKLLSVDPNTVGGVNIYVYRKLSGVGEIDEYDSIPYMQTTAKLTAFDNNYDAGFSMQFLGSLTAPADPDAPQLKAPGPGDVLKVVAFDSETGYYGEIDFTIPSPASADNGGFTSLDVLQNIELRPPLVSLDMNRVFFIDGIRRRSNIPHNGIAFTSDEFIEFRTEWITPVAVPLARPEIAFTGRLRVNSIDFKRDYMFDVTGGEHFRILEIRESTFASRLEVLQQTTDVGTETISISRDGSFRNQSLLPIYVKTDTYVDNTQVLSASTGTEQNVVLNILSLDISELDNGEFGITGQTLPGSDLTINGTDITSDNLDARGQFAISLSNLGDDGLTINFPGGQATQFGNAYTPVINQLTDTPSGLVPNTGSQGDLITINGLHFSPVIADNNVSFNGVPAVVQSATETQLQVIVPNDASSGDVTVAVGGKVSNGVRFNFVSDKVNNGSFEKGFFAGYTVEGTGRIIESIGTFSASHENFMAMLSTEHDPITGTSSLTTDPFILDPAQGFLLFDCAVLGTALFNSLEAYVDVYAIDSSGALWSLPNVLPALDRFNIGRITNYNLGSGMQTVAIDLSALPFAAGSDPIQIKIVLKARGRMGANIAGLKSDDENPLDFTKLQGTALLLDDFRFSNSGVLPTAIDIASLCYSFEITANSHDMRLNGDLSSLPNPPSNFTDYRIYVYDLRTGLAYNTDVNAGGDFTLDLPITANYTPTDKGYYLIYYGPNPSNSGNTARRYSPPIELVVEGEVGCP